MWILIRSKLPIVSYSVGHRNCGIALLALYCILDLYSWLALVFWTTWPSIRKALPSPNLKFIKKLHQGSHKSDASDYKYLQAQSENTEIVDTSNSMALLTNDTSRDLSLLILSFTIHFFHHSCPLIIKVPTFFPSFLRHGFLILKNFRVSRITAMQCFHPLSSQHLNYLLWEFLVSIVAFSSFAFTLKSESIQWEKCAPSIILNRAIGYSVFWVSAAKF